MKALLSGESSEPRWKATEKGIHLFHGQNVTHIHTDQTQQHFAVVCVVLDYVTLSCRCCCESGGRVDYSAGYSTSLAQYEKLSQHAVYLCAFAENKNEIV